jgi:type I restriction enzyme S subunit
MQQPTEWGHRRLRELMLPTAIWNPRNQPREFIHYVDVSAISREELRILSAPAVPANGAPSRARKIVKAGDTIFATVRPTLRRIAQIPASLDGEIVSTAFCVLRPDPGKVDPDFLFFAVQLATVMSGVAELETGASYPAVRDTDVLDQTIPNPSLVDQRDIAAALNATRAALLHDGQCEAASIELKRAAMRELFRGGLRREAQKETEIGPVPESWSVAPIGRFTKLSQYGLSIRGNVTGRYPILRMNCQEDGRVILRNLQYVDLDQATAQSFRVNRDDLLFNRTNSYELVGRTAIVEGDIDAVFASYLIRLSIDREHLLPRYLNYFLNWDFAQSELKKLASRAVGQANINATKLSGFTVPVPTIDEQREIVAILDAIDGKIRLHREKRTVLDELFKALLHKLMTGEIRAGDLDLSALAPARVAEAAQ